MKADEVISRVADLCREHGAKKVILYGSRAKGTAGERSDIDIAMSGGADFDELLEKQTVSIILQFAGCFGGGQGKRSYGFLCIKRNQCKI